LFRSMAMAFPESSFIGIEISERQAKDGQNIIKALGLKNVEIRQQNILDLNKDLGEFDYIITHGVYSWVQSHIQDKILQVIEDCLAPQGVACVSYNTFPGWHFRGMIRDMVLYHTRLLRSPQEKTTQARALIDFLYQSVPTENNAHSLMLNAELKILRESSDSYILHEYFEETNTPTYFHEFMERASSHGLQFLSEGEFATMITSNLPAAIQETLARISNDILKTEQYLDFVHNRYFRMTLLCRKDVQLNRNLTNQSIMPLYSGFAGKPKNENVDLNAGKVESFGLADGRNVDSDVPVVKAALLHLSGIWPEVLSMDDLFKVACDKLSKNSIAVDAGQIENMKAVLFETILRAYAANVMLLRSQAFPFVRELSKKPKSSPLARLQAEQQLAKVTNVLHEIVNTDTLANHMLVLMDGSRSKEQVLDEVVKLAQNGTLVIRRDNNVLTDATEIKTALQPEIESRFVQIRNAALLVG
ncbi:MAG: methyltransferase regulatory domain-containing protein, partial [Candidatus Obscuribacterales bacterium]|nr:methyltransferase regulatory domain-containing protein [Candidatus Obscuribacterales bacterium]